MPNLTQSQLAFRQAIQLMPGGVNSPARAFGAVGGDPIVFASAQGAVLTDIDGNDYLDYIGSWGPMILGHGHPRVVRAVTEAAQRGFSFGAPTVAENTIAQLIVDAVPSVEMVRLVNSGTEATMSAIRLARGFTQRDIVIKFSGNYHGHVDSLLVAAGSAAATLGVPDSPGVTAGCSQDTLLLPYNNVDAFQAAMTAHGDRVACVILEPVVGNMGCVRASDEFLACLRRRCDEHQTVLIFDEVMSGFRVAYGGAQELLAVTPDITTLGKIVGGGLPMGAYGGRADIMQQVLPAGKVFQAGTLSGNPIATAAGIATLSELKENPPYEQLENTSAKLAAGLQQCAERLGGCVQRVGSMMTLFFHPGPVRSWDDAAACDTKRYAKFFWELIDQGIYFPCSQFEALFVSAAHSDEDIQRTIDAALKASETI